MFFIEKYLHTAIYIVRSVETRRGIKNRSETIISQINLFRRYNAGLNSYNCGLGILTISQQYQKGGHQTAC